MESVFKAKINIFTQPIVNALKSKNLEGYLKNLTNTDSDNILRWYYFLKFYKYILSDNKYLTNIFEPNRLSYTKTFNKQLLTAMLEQEN
jgi:hypothetical protein